MDTSKESTSVIPSEKNSLLITEVRKFPSLYDTSDPNYYVLAERNKAWLQVAENCDEPADLCHLRWKSLRKRYAKEKRRIPEILQGRRRPWALFPKMSFLAPSTLKRRIKQVKAKTKYEPNNLTASSTNSFKQIASDDDMLIVDDNDEIVHSCKSVELSEEDEYIYETLDDPDSALEIMKTNPHPKVKPTAIRSGGSRLPTVPVRVGGTGRIRKLTPKMQNSIIAKKLKNAQQILQQSNVPSSNLNQKATALQKVMIENNKVINSSKNNQEKTVLYQDKTTRHIATVNPNIIRVERIEEKGKKESVSPEDKKTFKVVKLKGRNPVIFSPDQLPEIQSFMKSESISNQEETNVKPPLIKVKSVDNLNKQDTTLPKDNSENNNLDIIHSVGLVRKPMEEKCTGPEKISHQSYTRSYSWNRPTVKVANKQTSTEKIQPDSQTKDYEIEETWNDIKEEHIDDDSWAHPPEAEIHKPEIQSGGNMVHCSEAANRVTMWNEVNEAKLELVAFQRKLLEEQHNKNLEYMKKEHDLKMTLLKAEIDLKRKQLNIML